MKKISYLALVICILSACNTTPRFSVTGEITGAKDKTLYLEASGLEGIIPLDSVKLKENGSFDFKQERPESPEFYRLRIQNKIINFSIDSTETVTIKAPLETFSTGYTVEGSANSTRIKELTLKQGKLQHDINELIKNGQSTRMSNRIIEDSISALLNTYKQDIRTNYIYAAPNVTSSYFALFQKVNNYLIFDPLNSKEDVKSFAAVATSLYQAYPHADRSKNLYNLVIKGMKNTRPARQEEVVELPADKIAETGIIDIKLRDLKGNERKLSDLTGKVVVLDFTVYQSQVGAPHNLALRDLYNKYADKGLEIYQVSLDADEHFWRTTASNLPWVCVRDPQGIYSSAAASYNIQQLPSYYLINRKNELQARDNNITDLDAAIKRLL